jgi:hypothetical protein
VVQIHSPRPKSLSRSSTTRDSVGEGTSNRGALFVCTGGATLSAVRSTAIQPGEPQLPAGCRHERQARHRDDVPVPRRCGHSDGPDFLRRDKTRGPSYRMPALLPPPPAVTSRHVSTHSSQMTAFGPAAVSYLEGRDPTRSSSLISSLTLMLSSEPTAAAISLRSAPSARSAARSSSFATISFQVNGRVAKPG